MFLSTVRNDSTFTPIQASGWAVQSALSRPLSLSSSRHADFPVRPSSSVCLHLFSLSARPFAPLPSPFALRPVASLLCQRRTIGMVLWHLSRQEAVTTRSPPSRPAFYASTPFEASRRWAIFPSATPPRWSTGFRLGHEAFLRLSSANRRLVAHRLRGTAGPLFEVPLHSGDLLSSPHFRGDRQPKARRLAMATFRCHGHGGLVVESDWRPDVCGGSCGCPLAALAPRAVPPSRLSTPPPVALCPLVA